MDVSTGAFRVPQRPTTAMPPLERAGYKVLRQFSRAGLGFLGGIGGRFLFLGQLGRGFAEGRTWGPLVLAQMRSIGVGSVPLACIVAAFIGSVIALQIRYQLFPGIQLSIVGLSVRQIIILEMAPLLTGLVLTGRVGARMTAEIGTMRVTEQIDALETLAYDPVAYLFVPRLIAATLMLPVLVVLANVTGVVSGLLTAIILTDVTWFQFREGLQIGFNTFQIFYSLLKATLFGATLAYLCCYEGYVTEAGAEGVGRSTAKAVVVASVAILVLDAITAMILAPYLQG
jgi:phospholipid/cholesterol/gamma-HCH transport system permease protein